jgi:hypothetical protein
LSLSDGLHPREPLPHFRTHPNSFPFRVHNEITGNGVLYDSNRPSTPFPEVREALMGFNVDETSIPGLVTTKRVYLLGQSTYLNTMSCAIATIRAHITSLDPASHDPSKNTQRRGGFTFSQTLPYMENMPNHPYRGTTGSHRTPNPPPIPHQWTPKYIPKSWIYTDGSI